MPQKDYYKIMGLQRNATSKDIKAAYRKLAHKYHPDVSKVVDAEEKFKELRSAYVVLKDPQKRAVYDQTENELDKDWQDHQEVKKPPRPPTKAETETPPSVWLTALIVIYLCSYIRWPFGLVIAILIIMYLFSLF